MPRKSLKPAGLLGKPHLSQTMLAALEYNPESTALSAVIWLHGLGADGHDFETMPKELNLPQALQTRFIFPHAPKRPVTLNAGMVMRAWYDIASRDIDRARDRKGIEASLKEIEQLVDQELQRGIPPEKILIAGFSQGGVMATEALMAFPEKLNGAIVLSAYLPRPCNEIPKACGEKHLFMGHGTQDEIVDLRLGIEAREALQSVGYQVEWHEWRMGHTVCLEEIRALRTWIVQRLST